MCTTGEPPAQPARAFEQVASSEVRVSHTICIFEDGKFVDFFPLSLTRPLFDLRVGAGTLRARWLDLDPHAPVAFICRDYLAELARSSSRGVAVNAPIHADTLFVNARWLCFARERESLLARLPHGAVAVQGENVVAARVNPNAAAALAEYLHHQVSDHAVDAACALLESRAGAGAGEREPERAASSDLARWIDQHGLRRIDFDHARMLSFPWELIEHNSACIADDFEVAAGRGSAAHGVIHSAAHVVNRDRVRVGADAAVRAGVVIDATDGPVLIGEGAVIMPNATVIGPAVIGAGSVVKAGARILSGTSIGSVCKVGGEVDETIFADYSNKQHDGFLGHSYVGSWVNIGAATNNSDLKNNYGSVRMWSAGRTRETGRQFLGLLMGDHTKTGINAVFNTGTVVGFNCNLYSSELPDAFVPSFSWGHGRELVPYQLDKAIQTAALVMQRRGVAFADEHRRLFERVHDIVARSARNA